MSRLILQPLEFLYGAAEAARLARDVQSLLQRWRPQLPAPPSTRLGLGLSQQDALLITYPDQVHDADAPPLRSLAEFADRHLTETVSGIHLLPFFPWSSDDGFSVKNYFAVDPALGDWADVRRLGMRFDLMFDAVFNHLSAQGEWFQRFLADDPPFRDFFVTVEGAPDLSTVVRPRALPLLTEFQTARGPRKVWTTFSADQVDLNFKNPAVLLAVLDALLFYVSQGARFIRLDAIAFLWKQIGTPCLHLPQTHRVVQLMRALLDEAAPRTLLITETNVPHADNVSYFGDGRNEAQLVYNFALPPLVLHSMAAGNARALTRWARSLALPSDAVTFFNFLASHDGVGLNPVRGILRDQQIDQLVARTLAHHGFISWKSNPDGSRSPYEMNINYFDALSSPAAAEPQQTQVNRFLCAHAIMFALQGVPGIYFHSLFGSRGDRAGAEASGIPRRINRGRLSRAALERELATSASLRRQVFDGLRSLLHVRRERPALHPLAAQDVLELHPCVFAVRRTAPDERGRMLCLHNVSAEPVDIDLAPSAAAAGDWRVGHSVGAEWASSTRQARLGAHGMLWLEDGAG